MPMTLKLDTPAVRTLIEADEAFKFELQQAVIAELVRKLYTNMASGNLAEMLEVALSAERDKLAQVVQDDEAMRKEMAKCLSATVQSVRAGGVGYRETRKLSNETRTLIMREVEELVKGKIQEELSKAEAELTTRIAKYEAGIIKRQEDMLSRLETRLDRETYRQIRAQVANDIAKVVDAVATFEGRVTDAIEENEIEGYSVTYKPRASSASD
jgi:hypothetical protein